MVSPEGSLNDRISMLKNVDMEQATQEQRRIMLDMAIDIIQKDPVSFLGKPEIKKGKIDIKFDS